MKKGEIYTGTVEKMDFPNKGILHIGEEKVVVKNALPGQTVESAISKQRKGRCEGSCLRVRLNMTLVLTLVKSLGTGT